MTATIQVIVPLDPDDMAIGGIAAFVRGFVKHAPQDFAFEMVGVTRSRLIGAWHELAFEGRTIRLLPVARGRERRGGVPLAATFSAGLLRYRRRIPAGRLQQFHRPATALPLLGMPGPKTEVVHLPASALTSRQGESAWRRVGPALRLTERATLPRMDRVYVVNEAAADEYRAAFPNLAPRIRFVPNWVDDSVFQAPAAAQRLALRSELRETIGAGPEDRLILFAGRLEHQKDPLLAVRAAAEAMRSEPHARLVMAGGGSLRSMVEQAATTLGASDRVHLLGAIERPDLARWMAASDLLLVTSAFETGPTIGLEALATGLPVVMTPVGLVAGVVAGGGSGEVVAEPSPSFLGAAIGRVLAGDPARWIAACLAAVAPYRAQAVLPALYDDARALASGRADTADTADTADAMRP